MIFRLNKVSVIIILLYITFGHTDSLFVTLRTLQGLLNEPPVVVGNQKDKYFAIWKESSFADEYPHYKETKYFYQAFYATGKMIIPKHEIVNWRNFFTPYTFTENSVMFLDSNRLLVIARKMVEPLSDPPGYRLEKLIIDFTHGTILEDSNNVSFQNCSLVRDSEGNVYVIEYDVWSGIRVMQVYPEFTQIKHTSKPYLDRFRKNSTKYTEFKLQDAIMTATSNDRLLICNRMGWGYEKNAKKDSWDKFKPDKVFYTLADFDGNFIIDPIQLDLKDYAFQKIPGIHLGGIYYASEKIKSIDDATAAIHDMDLTKLPDGDIILSVTGKNDNGGLCVYQIKFNSEGKVIKPLTLGTTHAKPIPAGFQLTTAKVAHAHSVRKYLVMFGFDDNGSFYSHRELWDEVER